MKRSILKVMFAICVIALVGCGISILGKSIHIGTRYANAEQYTAGGATVTGAVKHLDINWLDGAVNIAYHAQDTVEIAETAPKSISEDEALRWWLDGDTLRIQYTKSGSFRLNGLNKALTVTLPEGIALESVAIDATSSAINVPDLNADSVNVDVVSGDIALKQSGISQRVTLSTTSGDIEAELHEVGRLVATTTSGGVKASVASAREISVSTTSGGVTLDGGDARKTDIDTTSGNIGVALKAFESLRIDATSGDVTAALPTQPGYRADVDTTSGRVDYEVALTRDGGAYACGDGSASVRIDTTSGNVRLTDVEGR